MTKYLLVSLLALAALSLAQDKQTFTGTITDDLCSNTDHSGMGMGPTDAACAAACVDEHGVPYVLYDGKNSYRLSDQEAPGKFAAQKVKVVGTLDAKTKMIQVDSISPSR